jgi:hypothetical protein
MTPTQIARLLALPVGWRCRLASMPGPGACYHPAERNHDAMSVHKRCQLSGDDFGHDWAWAPADRLAWLEATGAHWRVNVDNDPIIPCPIDAALGYMERNDPPG